MNSMALGFIGAGNMASAIIHIVTSQEMLDPGQIFITDLDEHKLARFSSMGIGIFRSNTVLVKQVPVVVLAVKPQVIESVLREIAPVSKGRYFISVIAGVSTDYIRSFLDPTAHIVRVMPNTPVLIGKGATVIAKNETVPHEFFKAVVNIFEAAGEVTFLEEDLFNEVIAVNASSPAFFFRMAECMCRTAEEQGIDPAMAVRLVAKTMEGAASMLLSTGRSPAELESQVTSPGGTTQAALTAFDEYRFDSLMREAMLRCTKRAYELGL